MTLFNVYQKNPNGFKLTLEALVGILRSNARVLSDAAGGSIRKQFAENFARESSGDDPWFPLAPRTQRERIEEGFEPEHPILQRTGSYRHSWVTKSDANHIHIVQSGFFNMIILEEGSADPRVDELSGGRWFPSTLIPRPVEELSSSQTGNIDTTVGSKIDQLQGQLNLSY